MKAVYAFAAVTEVFFLLRFAIFTVGVAVSNSPIGLIRILKGAASFESSSLYLLIVRRCTIR